MSDQPPPSKPRVEQQLAPGIYFSPAPGTSKVDSNASTEPHSVDSMTLAELRTERDTISTSIKMLEDSNTQMKQFDPDHKDKDIVEAIGENISIIWRRKGRLSQITERIKIMSPTDCETQGDTGIDGRDETNGDEGMSL